ncbi:MAG: V-type ATPase 116kDa subunit family protein [Thermodesulfovibrionales bacterium]|nr:V-type ATPase 116kDa subunit family protein [Thermodesulfovibrionales bacterium]
MIVRMSKVEIAGPKGLLQDVLSMLQESGIFQIEPTTLGFVEKVEERYIRPFLPDERSLSERLFLEDIKAKIGELFSYLPQVSVRKSYIEPRSIIDTVAENLKRHLTSCKELSQKKDALQKESDEINRYKIFLDAIESILRGIEKAPDIDFIGLTIKDAGAVEDLKTLLSRLLKDRFELLTAMASDGSLVGLVIAEKRLSEKIRGMLSDERIPEFTFPPYLSSLSFPEKIAFLKERIWGLNSKIKVLNEGLGRFAARWMPIYKRVMEWIDERRSLLSATASVFETRMCFLVYGWMPSGDVSKIRKQLIDAFEGKVVIEEKEIREEDMERVPVAIKNPEYFQPFELFVRLLPLPRYASYDPTPFIGIFFPLFFGMILGDAGYGIILMILSLFLAKKFKKRRNIQDAVRILLISSIYAIFFGILYGEFFGELPKILFGVEPICIERRTAIMPVLYFAVTVGVVHIILGIFLGAITAFKKKTKREALYKLLNIIVILCLMVLIASLFDIFPGLFTKPVVIAILILTPLLFFTGGLLAPFELLKNIGNIISYARIMAIGLTSVLLAFVANSFTGMAGNIVVGVVVAGLLHLINIILGVFSPTIHVLRLHYVEFFSKFIEPGGRRFEPLKK